MKTNIFLHASLYLKEKNLVSTTNSENQILKIAYRNNHSLHETRMGTLCGQNVGGIYSYQWVKS